MRTQQMPPGEGWVLQRLNEVSQLLHHCRCGLWHLVHQGPGGPGIPINPLQRRRPWQQLRLLLLLLGLLLGCCMDACNHLLRRRREAMPASAPVPVVAGAPVGLRRQPCLLRLLLLLLGLLLLANTHPLERLLLALLCCCTIPLNIPHMHA